MSIVSFDTMEISKVSKEKSANINQRQNKRAIVQPYSIVKSFNDKVTKIRFGYGECKSCTCKGFTKSKEDDGYCGTCGHAWSQHY